ncbi:MAG: hypothetical protein M1832_002688 [Thelocarpon impressellum]|nr:MAG: hypothetical protein M1832_002688 [Thelocarpon impressellum]
MAMTGLYFVPDAAGSSASAVMPALVDRLGRKYNPSPLSRWNLEHRLMRSTVASTSTSSSSVRYLQLLSLSHRPGRSYINVTPPQSQSQGPSQAATVALPSADVKSHEQPAGAMVAVPAPGQADELSHLLTTKMGPLWTSRQSLLVSHGAAFELEDFRVRLGELRQAQGAQMSRGVIIEVEWLGDSDGDGEGEETADAWETGELAIRAFWDALGLQGGRSYIRVAGVGVGVGGGDGDGESKGKGKGKGKGKASRALDLPRQYCELLRLRG